MKIAILSDTHNLLRPEALSALTGAEAILHAGDISSRAVLDQLRAMAPVYAVRGNADEAWAEDLPRFLDFTLDGLRFGMAHKKKDLPKDTSEFDVAVCGHSHQYSEARQGKTLYLNPGSCGPRRFHQPITLATAEIRGGAITVTRIDIAPSAPLPKIDPNNIKAQIEAVMKETARGKGPREIAEKYGLNPELTEQIARLYVTHPGVTADGIMAKMGL